MASGRGDYVRLGGLVLDDATVDSLCSYYTAKRVRIRDQRLGAVFFLCSVACIIYLAVEIIAYQGYLEFQEIIGSVRVDLISDAARVDRSSSYHYCNANSARASPRCAWLDQHELVFPAYEEGAIMITTRMASMLQERPAAASDVTAPANLWKTVGEMDDVYARGVEAVFNLTLAHSIYLQGDQENHLLDDAGTMEGVLVDGAGEPLMRMSGDELTSVPLSMVLRAANVSLDEVPEHARERRGGATGVDFLKRTVGRAATRRDLGVVLVVMLTYNSRSTLWRVGEWKEGPTLEYTMSVHHLQKERFSVDEISPRGPGRRFVNHRAGLRLRVIQKGHVGYYSFRSLLLNIAGGLVILNAATFAVDNLARYVLPDRHKYYSYMFEEVRPPPCGWLGTC